MKTYQKIALIILLTTGIFQAQAITFAQVTKTATAYGNALVEFVKNNPKTTAAIAAIVAAYALGVSSNLKKTGNWEADVVTTLNTPESRIYKTHTFMQTLKSFLFPFAYGLIAPTPEGECAQMQALVDKKINHS